MKKRILSFLLVLCMLVAMVPVTAAVAEENGSTESQADAVYAENYLDLYVTEGLTVLFDANSLSSDMITFGETADSAGIWYGYTVDAATGKLVKNESYVANPCGGAYNEETNPFGWKKLENGGIAWDEPDSRNANYYLHFKEAWLGKAFEVELVYEPYLRDTTEGFLRAETVVDYSAEEIQWYVNEETGKPIEGASAGLVYADREVVEKDVTTGLATLFKRTTGWNSGAALANNGTSVTIYLIDGKPGETITLKGSYGTYAYNEANETIYAGYTSSGAVTYGDVTFDEEGCAVITAPVRGSFFEVILPLTTEALIDKVEANIFINQFAYDQTIVIGNLYGMIWSNKLASNTWSNGFGMARWSLAKASWEGSPAGNTNTDATKANLLYLGCYDDTTFAQNDDRIMSMSVVNTGTAYQVKYPTASFSYTLDASKANEDGTYSGQNFKVLQYMGGAAYGMRVYSAPLNADQRNQNYFADLAARYGLDVTGVDLGKLELLAYVFTYFASNYKLEGEDAAAMQAQLDEMLTWAADVEATAYDALYVQDGLVALYTAYNGDASVNLANGLWFAKKGATAVINGASCMTVGADGFGTGAWTGADWEANRSKIGVAFSESYVESKNFTVDVAVGFNTITDLTGTQYDGNRTQVRVDLFALTAFVGKSGSNAAHFRGVLTYCNWSNNGAHNGQNGVALGFNGATSGYRAASINYVTGAINSMNFSKQTLADNSVTLKLISNGGSFANATITSAQVAQQVAATKPTESKLSFLNGVPGTMYAVRVYDRVLSDAELKQNKLVDILAYAGVDLDTIDFEEILASSAILDAVTQGGIGQSAKTITDIIASFDQSFTMTDYDKLYVQRGLVALYSAFDTDDGTPDSLTVVDGKVTGWVDKINKYSAAVKGNFVANLDGDGGFGIAQQTYEQWQSNHTFGVSFADSLADLSTATVENVIRYRTHTNNHASSTDAQFDSNAVAIRYDIFAGLVWNNNPNPTSGKAARFHVRTMLTYGGWNQNGCNGSTAFRANGTYGGYCGNGYDLTPNKLVTHTFYKVNDGTNVNVRIAIDDKTVDVSGVGKAEGKITVAQYDSIRKGSGATTAKFSNLNGVSGTMYAVRVYNVGLTTAEVRQNKLVDLLAYAEADLTNYPTEATELAMLANLIAEKGWSFGTADLKTKLEAAMSRGVTTVTYKNALTGETIKSFLEIKGEYLTLPEYIGNKAVVEWDVNGDDAVASDNVVYNAVVIEKPTANNGVSVRVDGEDVGLRFTTVLDKASYGDLTIKYGAENVKLGMLVSTSDIVAGAGAFTKDAIDLYAAGNAGYVDIAINGYYKMTEGGDYELAGVLTNIKDSSLDAAKVKFVSVLYIEIDTDADGVSDVTVYGSASAAKSVKEVADATKAAIDAADVDSGLTAEAEATFNTWYAAKFPTAE